MYGVWRHQSQYATTHARYSLKQVHTLFRAKYIWQPDALYLSQVLLLRTKCNSCIWASQLHCCYRDPPSACASLGTNEIIFKLFPPLSYQVPFPAKRPGQFDISNGQTVVFVHLIHLYSDEPEQVHNH